MTVFGSSESSFLYRIVSAFGCGAPSRTTLATSIRHPLPAIDKPLIFEWDMVIKEYYFARIEISNNWAPNLVNHMIRLSERAIKYACEKTSDPDQ